MLPGCFAGWLAAVPVGLLTQSAAVAHALTAGLLPQWRARAQASRRVARALGLRELGSQLSVRLDLDRLNQ